MHLNPSKISPSPTSPFHPGLDCLMPHALSTYADARTSCVSAASRNLNRLLQTAPLNSKPPRRLPRPSESSFAIRRDRELLFIPHIAAVAVVRPPVRPLMLLGALDAPFSVVSYEVVSTTREWLASRELRRRNSGITSVITGACSQFFQQTGGIKSNGLEYSFLTAMNSISQYS